ncbi:UDP-N-acetylglucosamine 2-epimerase (hydrolyzing), partial [Candidatus Woesearchaeota archaeon]|nr:UDP-N-acetylglucosamine 2-epimerase (hydrolyzing) [Candidatus Woesearchaeota archaeon]
DVSGSVDDMIRHSITKLAHIHLPGTEKSAERIINMGEEPWRVKVVGTPMNMGAEMRKEDIEKSLGIKLESPVLLVVQHPVTSEAQDAGDQMEETMKAIVELGKTTIVVYPNSDAGNKDMIRIIEKYSNQPFISTYRNIESDIFINLLRNVDVMIGNSSSGIVEAPFFRLPVVNIGTRQRRRERGDNVIDTGYDRKEIITAIDKCIDKDWRRGISYNPYSQENNPEDNILDFLNNLEINPGLLNKSFEL